MLMIRQRHGSYAGFSGYGSYFYRLYDLNLNLHSARVFSFDLSFDHVFQSFFGSFQLLSECISRSLAQMRLVLAAVVGNRGVKAFASPNDPSLFLITSHNSRFRPVFPVTVIHITTAFSRGQKWARMCAKTRARRASVPWSLLLITHIPLQTLLYPLAPASYPYGHSPATH